MDLQFPHHENEIAQSEGATAALRQRVDAQRLPQRRQREDVQVAGQLLHHRRRAEALRRRDAALLHAAHALPQPVQLQRRQPRRRTHRRCGACTPRWRPAGDAAADGQSTGPPPASAFKAAMDDDFNTPARWPCCSNWPRRQPQPRSPRPLRCCCGAGPARWACCSSRRAPTCRRARGWTMRCHPGADRAARRRPRPRATSPRPTASVPNWPRKGIELKDSAQGTTWVRLMPPAVAQAAGPCRSRVRAPKRSPDLLGRGLQAPGQARPGHEAS
jgi:cysteinyl-tRNA synthetase